MFAFSRSIFLSLLSSVSLFYAQNITDYVYIRRIVQYIFG